MAWSLGVRSGLTSFEPKDVLVNNCFGTLSIDWPVLSSLSKHLKAVGFSVSYFCCELTSMTDESVMP